MAKFTFFILILSQFGSGASVFAKPPGSCAPPNIIDFEFETPIKAVDRSAHLGFTQGLEMRGGALMESTGAFNGKISELNLIDMNGRVTTLAKTEPEFFGEGLTFLDDRAYQLTWEHKLVLTYDFEKGTNELDQSSKAPIFKNSRRGWGLTNNGRRLISSDGSDELWFHDPKDFSKTGSVRVRDDHGFVSQLNELEFVKGKVFANVSNSNEIVQIDPDSGCVVARADLVPFMAALRAQGYPIPTGAGAEEFIANGIAYDKTTDSFFLTGKNWPVIVRTKMILGRSKKYPPPPAAIDKNPPPSKILE